MCRNNTLLSPYPLGHALAVAMSTPQTHRNGGVLLCVSGDRENLKPCRSEFWWAETRQCRFHFISKLCKQFGPRKGRQSVAVVITRTATHCNLSSFPFDRENRHATRPHSERAPRQRKGVAGVTDRNLPQARVSSSSLPPPPPLLPPPPPPPPPSRGSTEAKNVSKEELEALLQENLSIKDMARRLGMSRPTLYKLLKKHKLECAFKFTTNEQIVEMMGAIVMEHPQAITDPGLMNHRLMLSGVLALSEKRLLSCMRKLQREVNVMVIQ
ncbi:hypothetical protein ACOMHN_052560 [Nucella lapillus]